MISAILTSLIKLLKKGLGECIYLDRLNVVYIFLISNFLLTFVISVVLSYPIQELRRNLERWLQVRETVKNIHDRLKMPRLLETKVPRC